MLFRESNRGLLKMPGYGIPHSTFGKEMCGRKSATGLRSCDMRNQCKGIAFALQPLYGTWQGVFHVFFGFERIVKYENGTVARIFLYIGQHLFGRHMPAVVPGDHIPHYDAIASLVYCPVLRYPHMAVRRPEEGRADQLGCLCRIVQQVGGLAVPSLYMVESVIACSMAPFQQHPVNIGVFPHIVAHAEEGGFHVVSVQKIQYPGGDFRDGAVIKREVDRFLARHFDSPD